MTDKTWLITDVDYENHPITEIGGKARGLGVLVGLGVPCPPSFCITTTALRYAVEASTLRVGKPEQLPESVRNIAIPSKLAEAIRRRVAQLPPGPDGQVSVAVRSSFVSEDSPDATSPGVYLSEIGVTDLDEVEAAIRRVWNSAFTPESMAYRESANLPVFDLGMAVVVQQALSARVGGVAYTVVPGIDDPTAVLIEYTAGSPADVVENRGAISTCVVDKRTRTLPLSLEGPLERERAAELVELAVRLERVVGAPLDLEWLVDEHGELRLLQARPLPYTAGPVRTGPFVGEARGTLLRSTKLAPFQLAGTARITTVPASLILPAAFEDFKANNGRITPTLAAACREIFAGYLRNGAASMRSAYWSALDSGDLMPTSGPFTDADAGLSHVEAFWRYIIDNDRDDYTAEVALLVSNWTDLRASVIAIAPGPLDPPVATVSALYGQLDGLEACSHDVYDIDLDDLRVVRSTVSVKQHAVTIPGQPPEPVQEGLWTAPVLDAYELRAIARNLAEIRQVFGAARVEHLVLNGPSPAETRVVTWQVSPLAEGGLRYYTVRPVTDESVEQAVETGTFVEVNNPEDVRALQREPHDKLLYIDFTRAVFRNSTAANAMGLDLKRAGYPVLLKGSLLSHFAALLRDYAVTVYPVPESLDYVRPSTRIAVIPW
jgi:hypothetical protein